MHGKAFSHRKGITVIPPYSEGSYEYTRNGRKPAITNVYDAVQMMLEEMASTDEYVWWNTFPYTISIRPDYTERGTYVYSVAKVPPKVSLTKSDDPWVNTATVGKAPF